MTGQPIFSMAMASRADGDLLAGGQQHIHLPLGGVGVDLLRLFDQVVGGVALGGDHHHHVVARVVGVRHDARHVEHPVAIGAPSCRRISARSVPYLPPLPLSTGCDCVMSAFCRPRDHVRPRCPHDSRRSAKAPASRRPRPDASLARGKKRVVAPRAHHGHDGGARAADERAARRPGLQAQLEACAAPPSISGSRYG